MAGQTAQRVALNYPTQQQRLITGGLYVVLLLVASYVINGQWLPPFNLDGLWLYGAFVPMLLARHIIEHWFARPADVLADGLALLTATATLSSAGAALSADQVNVGRAVVELYAVTILLLAIAAMLGRAQGGLLGAVAPFATDAAQLVGQAQVGFSLFLGLAALAAYADDTRALAVIAAAWVLVVPIRPLERIVAAIAGWKPPLPPAPEIVTEEMIEPRLVWARTRSKVRLGDAVEWASGSMGRVVNTSILAPDTRILIALTPGTDRPIGRARLVTDGRSRSNSIGFVSRGTTIQELVVESSAAASAMPDVAEGRLVAASVAGQETFFQITGAAVDERRDPAARRDVISITARKLGVWDESERGFALVPWVPDAGTEVRLVEKVEAETSIANGVGRLPGTNYRVGIDIEKAVLYNCAILGILGVGKTSLAWELIQRMLCAGLRVVVIDITGEYAIRFRELWSLEQEEAINDRIEGALARRRANGAPPRERAGNWVDVRPAIRALLEAMAASDSRLLIINPSRIDATAEDGFPQGGAVPLRRLTNVEVVRLIAEELLDFARTTTPADPTKKLQPRICLVLEEAHSLVPEGASTADRSDQTATAGTARAVLQGRKYGLGCLLITQRTANVTKTILNQCHTVFAMRSFDATSETFLANYLGREYASLLSTLQDRQAVLFGRASTSSAPVLIDLNDRDRFTDEFWQTCAADVPLTDLERRPVATGETGSELSDDEFRPDSELDEEPPWPEEPS